MTNVEFTTPKPRAGQFRTRVEANGEIEIYNGQQWTPLATKGYYPQGTVYRVDPITRVLLIDAGQPIKVGDVTIYMRRTRKEKVQ